MTYLNLLMTYYFVIYSKNTSCYVHKNYDYREPKPSFFLLKSSAQLL